MKEYTESMRDGFKKRNTDKDEEINMNGEYPLISVIVPVYNTENYLEECISSIVGQTYPNLEILLIDDGSQDHSGKICDDWAKKDARILVIHKKNTGVSDSRNTGIERAKGAYVGFVDSDDWIQPEMYQALWKLLEKHACGIACCGIQRFAEGQMPQSTAAQGCEALYTTQQALEELIRERRLHQIVCDKLYRADIVKQVAFPVGKRQEDEFWSYQVLAKSDGVALTDWAGYCYRQHDSSFMNSGFSLNKLSGIEAKQQRQAFIEENFPALSDLARTELFRFCIYCQQMTYRHLKGEEQIQACKVIADAVKSLKGKKLCAENGKQKLWLALEKVSYRFAAKLRNLLGVGF